MGTVCGPYLSIIHEYRAFVRPSLLARYSMPTQLRQLLDLITNSIETLEKTCAANGTEVPDLQGIFSPASEAFRADPVAGEAADIISAAALQLSAIVAPPHITLFNAVGGVSLILV